MSRVKRHVMEVKARWKSHTKQASYLVVIVVVARHICQSMPVSLMGKSQVSWRLIAAADTNSGSFRHLRVQSTNRAVKATIFTSAFSGCRRKHRGVHRSRTGRLRADWRVVSVYSENELLCRARSLMGMLRTVQGTPHAQPIVFKCKSACS
jgi:hypothetical protein